MRYDPSRDFCVWVFWALCCSLCARKMVCGVTSKCACACVRFQDGFSKCCEGHPSITARPYCVFAHLAKRSPPVASRPCRTASASARPKCRFHACRWRTRVSRSSYFLFTSRRCSQNTLASCHVFRHTVATVTVCCITPIHRLLLVACGQSEACTAG